MRIFFTYLWSEVLWAVRRLPVVILALMTWLAFEASNKESHFLAFLFCAYGYLLAHRYLTWVENKYEGERL